GIEEGQWEPPLARRPIGGEGVVARDDLSALVKNGPRNGRCLAAAADVLDLAYQFRKIRAAGPIEVHCESDDRNGSAFRNRSIVFSGDNLIGHMVNHRVIDGEATAKLSRVLSKTAETIRDLGIRDNRYGISLG